MRTAATIFVGFMATLAAIMLGIALGAGVCWLVDTIENLWSAVVGVLSIPVTLYGLYRLGDLIIKKLSK